MMAKEDLKTAWTAWEYLVLSAAWKLWIIEIACTSKNIGLSQYVFPTFTCFHTNLYYIAGFVLTDFTKANLSWELFMGPTPKFPK